MALFGSKTKKKASEVSGEMVVNIGRPVPQTINTVPVASQPSLDALFAMNNNMWVCDKCETLNNASADRCIACGNRR